MKLINSDHDPQLEESKKIESPPQSQIPWVRADLVHKKDQRYYFDTSDLIIIALFTALGGILSTFIGYLGNMVNSILLLPFGGGQIMAGLHTFWIIFVYLLARRKTGTALLVGVLKGFVEFFSGSAHGILVIVLSGTQGLVIEIFLIFFIASENKKVLSLAAGFATASNVIIQQIIFFNSQIPIQFIGLILLISFTSGILLGGLFPIYIYGLFESSSILNWRKPPQTANNHKYIKIIRISIIVIIILSECFMLSFIMFRNRYSAEVTGSLYNPYTYYPIDFIGQEITVEAELRGDVTYIPPKNYTGISLAIIIARGQPIPEFYYVRISASDGYFVIFNSTAVKNDPTIIIITSDSGLTVVAGNFHGSFWVRKVIRIEISE